MYVSKIYQSHESYVFFVDTWFLGIVLGINRNMWTALFAGFVVNDEPVLN